MKLVVGLGNPGREYVGTRHNVGFEVVDRLAEKLGWIAKGDFDRMAKSKFDGLAYDGSLAKVGGDMERLVLLKPTTYMNLSGKAVQAAMGFYQLEPADIMVVVDELALPSGKLRLRQSGSDGGHNGLKDIQRALGTNQYPRLRMGIDAPPPPIAGKDYVLGRFSPDQRKLIDPALDRAAGAIVTWIDKGINAAMNQFNADTENQGSSGQTKS
jgi:PTH1 family peptidyl-tRNA hydrolase